MKLPALPRSASFAGIKHLCFFLALCALAITARAQFTYSEDFKNSTAPGWVLNPAGNSTPNVILTSGATPRTGDPEVGNPTIDPSGSGWLRLTNNTLNTHNAVYFDTPIPSAGNSVTVTFGMNQFFGNNFNSTGADGITFFLYDASKTFQVGADGGSIGYAQKTGVDGLNGGFVAVALDAYGNFSVNGEGRIGGTTGLQPNSVAVRGPGQGQTGYNYLAGTGNIDYTDSGSPTVSDGTDGPVPVLPYTMAFPTATARPNQSTEYRNVSITINENSQLLVSMQFGEDGLWYQLLNVDLSSFVRPEQLKLGFSAGTGSGTSVTEVGGLLTIQATAGTGNFIWDNRNGPSDSGVGNSVWGTGANDPLNWAGQTNPTLKSNVIFNSTYISSVQNIDVKGSDKVITNMYFSGANSYNLTTSEARKLIFDSSSTLTSINLTNDFNGNAAHSIGLDLQMNKNLDINNNITPTFTISGNIDTGGNVLGLKGTGTTVLSGAVSGSGSLVKSDTGTTIIRGSGVNTYTGNTTVTGGTLQIEKASALGSTSAGTVVSSGATLALGGTGTTFDAETLSITGTGVSNAGALRNIGGANTWTGAVSLGGAGNNNIGVDAGSLNISGVISGAAGNDLNKVGTGLLTLSGANTFSGNTIIGAGTVAISNDNNLGTAPGAATAGKLVLNGGTLENTASLTLNANRGITLGNSSGTFLTDTGTTLTYNGVAAGSGALNKTGSGTMVLGGVNTYTGATNISQGTLQLGVNNALGNTAVTVSSGATFNVNNVTDTIGSLAGAGAVTLGTGSLTAGSNNTSTTYSGNMSGTGGSFTKIGNGTMTITGTNTYTGNTTIGNGTANAANILNIGSSTALSSSSPVVLSGGTLAIGGNFNASASGLVLTANSEIDFGSNTSQLTFGNATRTGGTLTIDNWAGSAYGGGSSQLIVSGFNLATSGFTGNATLGTINEISFNGWGSGALRLASGEIVPNTGGTIYTYAQTGSNTWATDNNWSDNGLAANADPGNYPGRNAANTANTVGDTAILGSAITAPATITLGGDRTIGYLVVNNANKYTISGNSTNSLIFDVNSGQAQLVNQGAGGVDISAPIKLSDALTLTQTGNGTVNLTGGITNLTGTNNIVVNGDGAGLVTVGSVIATGTGTLIKNGNSTLVLSGVNTFTGATTVNGGTVSIAADTGLGTAPGVVTAAQLTLNGGTLQTTGNFTLSANRGVTLSGTGGTFNTTASTALTYGGIIAGNAGADFIKSGAGTMIISGTNTYAGNTVISGGTLQLGSGTSIPNTSAVTLTGANTTLNLAGFSETIGSLASSQTTATLALGAGTLTTGSTPNTQFDGIITGTGGLTKVGNSVFTLTGNSTYSGATNINVGTLNVQNSNALGTTAGGTTIASGATLELQNDISIGDAINFRGTGFATNGAIRNVSGNNTLTGALTISNTSPTSIKSESGTLTIAGNIAPSGANRDLVLTGAGNITINGTMNLDGSGTGGTLTKTDTGYVILGNANVYTGSTTISGGTLEIRNNTALGSTGLTTIGSGATLALSGGITSSQTITATGQGVSNLGSIRNLSGNNTLTGGITLGGGTYFGVDGNSTLTTTGIISGGANDLSKVGTGTLILNGTGNNTYTGTTAVAAGTLEIRQAGQLGSGVGVTTVADGATLRINNAAGVTVQEVVTFTGAGVGGLGALQNSGGNNTWSGNLTMNGNTSIGSAAGTTLTASGTIANAINSSYSLTKVDAGNLVLSGVNTYSGTTTVRNGTLTVNSSAPVSTNGSLGNSGSTVQVGDSGTATTDNLGLIIGTNSGLSIDRAISINNFNTSGNVTMGGSNLSGTNAFNGNIGLGRNVIVTSAGNATTTGTVNYTGVLSGTGGVTAVGNGTTVFSGANTYTGATTITSGAKLVAASGSALGATSGAVTINSGGTLGLQGGITLPGAQTISSAGTVSNISGNNNLASPVTLTGATTFNTVAGDLTVSGIVSGAQNITSTAAAGTKIFYTGANTNSGTTTISGSGTTVLANPSGQALGSTTSVTINSGATLALGASNQINNSANLVLGGTFALNGNSEGSLTTAGLNNLSISTSGTLDYTGNAASLRFNSDTTGGTLTISGWAGDPINGGGAHQLLINTATTNIPLGNITFTDWGTARIIATSTPGIYEILPSVTNTNLFTWDGSTDGVWATGANWTRGDGNLLTAPGNTTAGQIITFGDLGQARLTADLGAGSKTVGRIYFENTDGTANNYTLSNGTLNLDGTGTSTAEIVTSTDVAPTISTNITAADNVRITNNSTGTLNLSATGNSFNMNGNDLTVTGSGLTTIAKIISGTGTDLTKSGSGTLALSGVNTYVGNTTISNGTLRLDVSAPSGAAGSLGTNTTAVILNDSTTTASMDTALLTNGAGVNVGRDITVGNFGNSTTIGGLNTTGTSTFSGNIALGKTTNLTAASGGNVSFTGILSGTGTINKTGPGNVIIGGSGNSTWTGNLDIQAGALIADKTAGGYDQLGVIQGAIGDLAQVNLSGATSVLAFRGGAPGNYELEEIGSLSGVSGSKLDLASATNPFTVYTGNNNLSTTFAGNITNSGGGALSIVKQGTGTMTLSGANSYTGNTTVTAGMLVAANNTALGSSAAGTTVLGNSTLGLTGGITVTGEQLNLTAITSPNVASLANLAGSNIWTGNISMVGTTANDAVKYDAAGGSTLTISGVISEATNAKVFAKTGTGTIVLSGANTYTGSTNVAAGTLIIANNNALGSTAAGTSVQIGATLGVQGNISVASGETYTLNGTTNPPGAPSLKNISDTNNLDGAILLSGGINTGVAIDSNSGTLTLNGAITQNSNPNFIIKTGSGDLQLSGTSANTFSGNLIINDGKVIAAKTAGLDATGAGNINIGDSIGATNSAVLQLNASNQINNNSNVTIATDGKLDIQTNSDTISALTMGGGSVTGSGTLALGGNLTFNGVGSATATITANIDLNTAGTRIVQVGNNGVNNDVDLSISGIISGTGGSSFNKTDLGVLELTGSGANTFTGGFQVSDGTVLLNKSGAALNTATGASNSVTVGDGANAADTAILKLSASNQIKDTATVTVNSDGQFNVNGLTETIGAIAGTGGHIETGSGLLNIVGNNSVSAFSGRLTDSTGAFDVNGNVTTLGGGRVVLDMDQDHNGSGQLTFNSTISYAGTLELKSGTLFLPGVVVNLGALEISGNTILDFGDSAASVLNVGSIKMLPGATLTINHWVSNVDFFFAQTWLAGPLGAPTLGQRGVGDETSITFAGYSSSQTAWLDYNGTKHEITPAPEPATYGAIFMGAAIALFGYRRWRKTSAADSVSKSA